MNVIRGHVEGKQAVDDRGACLFCRALPPETDEETLILLEKCIERKNARAMHLLAMNYINGDMGLQKDWTKAVELMLEAGKLGCTNAYGLVGDAYRYGHGVEKDLKKARQYYELGAIGGGICARQNLGELDWEAGHHERAYKHFLILGKAGWKNSLENIRIGFEDGYITKDDYIEALRAYQKEQKDTKSAMRDEAIEYETNRSLYQEKIIKQYLDEKAGTC